jgi:hypothetical protein
MKPSVWVPAVVAMAIYLPTVRYGFVQDDRAIIVSNPAAHKITDAIRAFDDPYWPRSSGAGLYRPLTIVTYAVDWTLSGGRPGSFHVMNAFWHGLATLLVALLLARWLPPFGVLAGGLLFAVHPVHVEAVANIVSRSELLAACGLFAAVYAARRSSWPLACLLAAGAMFAKEHGVVAIALILLDDWLDGGPRYPRKFYATLFLITVVYFLIWRSVGSQGASDVAAPFIGATTAERLAMALPATARAASLLVWPLDLSADYSPQVIAARTTFSVAAAVGVLAILAVAALIVAVGRRAPAVAFGAGVGAFTYLPTANLLFPAGIVLAERNLYEAVFLPAAALAMLAAWIAERRDVRLAGIVVGAVILAFGARTLARLPAWQDNRSFLITLLTEHPESYRAHFSAAAVSAGMGDADGARRQYALADSLYPGDPHLKGSRAFFLLAVGDSGLADALARQARRANPRERMALRVQVLLARARGQGIPARALADSAIAWNRAEETWYRAAIPELRQ